MTNSLKKRVTLKDVAQAAGVHVSTASRALDPNSKTSLTDTVSEKIKRIANELGYRPNRIAAGLRTNRTMSIGVMIPDITNTIFPPIVRGIESVLEPEGYASIVVNTDNIASREERLMEVLRERGVDGIISAAAHRDDPGLSELVKQGVPFVTINRRVDQPTVPYVAHDEQVGLMLVLRHLFNLGHVHIGHIAGPSDLSTGQERLHAYISGCKSLGLDESATTIKKVDRYTEEEGHRCAVDLMTDYPETTAIVCANDRLAIGAYTGIASMGLNVPADVSVTGFNDSPILEMIPPRMTTIRIQQFEAGRKSAQILLNAIRGENREESGTVLPVKLIVRDSTTAPRTR